MAYSSFLVARGLAGVFFRVGLVVDASASDALARVVVFLVVAAFGAGVVAFASTLVSAAPLVGAFEAGLASDALASALGSAFASDLGFDSAGFAPEAVASDFF